MVYKNTSNVHFENTLLYSTKSARKLFPTPPGGYNTVEFLPDWRATLVLSGFLLI